MQDNDIIQAVLASCAIPHVFEPVEIEGALYADGGVNNPAYPKANSDKTPIRPLLNHSLDFIIVVYLSDMVMPDYSKYITKAKFIDIIPSAPLEIIKGSGTMDFTKEGIKRRIQLGYADTMDCMVPLMMDLLKG